MDEKQNRRRDGNRKLEKKRQKIIQEIISDKAIKYEQADTLKVIKKKGKREVLETDRPFVDSINSICHATQNVLGEIIQAKDNILSAEECSEIHYRANLHRRANMININSHRSKNQIKVNEALKSLYCYCGCERFKGKSYPACHDLQELSFIGSGILLYFLLLRGLVWSTLLMLLIYGLYALAVYSQGTRYLTPPSCQAISVSDYRLKTHYSSFNADNLDEAAMVLDWLGLAAMILWIFISRLVKHYGFYQNEIIDENLKSSSDFAIKIDNLPQGEYNEEELYEFFEQLYERKIKNVSPEDLARDILHANLQDDSKESSDMVVFPAKREQSHLGGLTSLLGKQIVEKIQEQFDEVVEKYDSQNHFHIKSIQIIYRMQFSRKIISKIISSCRAIKQLMKQADDNQTLVLDMEAYQQAKKDIIETYETLEDLRKKFLSDAEFRQKITTRTAIIEFVNQKDMELVVKNFGHQSLTFYKRLKETFAQWTAGSSMVMFKGRIPNITRAPEPSDVLWENCEKSFSYLRIFCIFLATFAIICVSLGIITGLQALQFALRDCSTTEVSQAAFILRILTSIVLVIINAVLWILLKFLLDYEYNHTLTGKITSLMNKAFLATWINIIIIPIVVNYVVYDQFYGSIGVAGLVFDYQMIALAVSLPLFLINPVEVLPIIAIKIQCVRNYFIRVFYRKKEEETSEIKKDLMNKVYAFYGAPEFAIEEAYTFIFPNIMHALFYCQLQPLVLIFVFAQTFLFYWVCKIKVLKMCKIPAMTDRLIFEVAIYQVMLAPIFYGAGSFFNSYVSHKIGNPSTNLHIIGSIICFGIGSFNYLNPGNIFQRIVVCISECFSCLRKENIYRDLFQIQKANSKLNESKNTRLENYYRHSNSLSLLGFEKHFFKEVNNRQIEHELQSFCESHVGPGNQNRQKDEVNSEVSKKSRLREFMQMEVKPSMAETIFD